MAHKGGLGANILVSVGHRAEASRRVLDSWRAYRALETLATGQIPVHAGPRATPPWEIYDLIERVCVIVHEVFLRGTADAALGGLK